MIYCKNYQKLVECARLYPKLVARAAADIILSTKKDDPSREILSTMVLFTLYGNLCNQAEQKALHEFLKVGNFEIGRYVDKL